MSEWHDKQKFKVVRNGEENWVKEKNPNNPNRADRHPIEKGPRGGESFVGNDGKRRDAKAVVRSVEVWNEDKVAKAPQGEGYAGNGGQKKK